MSRDKATRQGPRRWPSVRVRYRWPTVVAVSSTVRHSLRNNARIIDSETKQHYGDIL